eukprot:TRINITY_DN29640_c0_g1_i2.p1 TRINITY_DN29640_c0_g1~~TRINITY_DN29640_c0_g1_i2.p1  ORF type:complete len:265 (+),score=64.28 TRINITY_DN29640_c0_g1_i2:63-857(+)
MVKVVLLRYWHKKNDHTATEAAEAWEEHVQSATTAALLEVADISSETTVRELKELLRAEASRIAPTQNNVDDVWIKPVANRILEDKIDIAFNAAESYGGRLYFEGDDNTTIGDLVKQRSKVNVREEKKVDKAVLNLYVTEPRPPPGNLYFKTLNGNVVSVCIPEEKFNQTTVDEALDLYCQQTGTPKDQVRLIASGTQISSLDRCLSDWGIWPGTVLHVVLRLRGQVPTNTDGSSGPPPESSPAPADAPKGNDREKDKGGCAIF